MIRSTAFVCIGIAAISVSAPSALGQSQKTAEEQLAEWRELRSHRIHGHSEAVMQLVFSADGELLISRADNNVRFLGIPASFTGVAFLHQLRDLPAAPKAIAADGDHRVLLALGQHPRIQEQKIFIREFVIGRSSPGEAAQHAFAADLFSRVAISPDLRTIAIGGWDADNNTDDEVGIYRLEDGKLLHQLEGHKHFVTGLCFSPDGKLLASGDGEGMLRLWSVTDGTMFHERDEHFTGLDDIIFSPDGRLLATSEQIGGPICIFEVAQLKLLSKLKWDSLDFAFSPDNRLLAVCNFSDDQPYPSLHLLRVPDGKLLQTLVDEKELAQSVAFSPEGDLLATGLTDGMVYFFAPEGAPPAQAPD